MPYPKNQIPDALLPVSMMPRVETPLKSDLLYLVQPGNNPVFNVCGYLMK